MKLFLLIAFILLKSCSGDSPEVRVEITPEKQTQIFAGLTTVKERAICAGYTKRLGDFKTKVVMPTEFKNGVGGIIYNGGLVAGYYDLSEDVLVLVDQPNLTAITIHEATHRIYKFNNPAKYEATKDHTGTEPFDLAECKENGQ